MSVKLLKKGFKFADLNICRLNSKVHDLSPILLENDIHIMAITETHLDETIEDTVVAVQGYNVFRLDRDRQGGEAAFYIQNHIPGKI